MYAGLIAGVPGYTAAVSLLLSLSKRMKPEKRPCLLLPNDQKRVISKAEALELLDKGLAVLIYPNPLKIRLAQFDEYKREERRCRGRRIPGVHRMDPSRLAGRDHQPCAFEHRDVRGSDQGRAFPPPPVLSDAELAIQREKRELARRQSQDTWDREQRIEEEQKALAERHNRGAWQRVQTSAHPRRAA